GSKSFSGSVARLADHLAVHPDRASASAAGRASGLAARPAVRLGRPAGSAGRLGSGSGLSLGVLHGFPPDIAQLTHVRTVPMSFHVVAAIRLPLRAGINACKPNAR